MTTVSVFNWKEGYKPQISVNIIWIMTFNGGWQSSDFLSGIGNWKVFFKFFCSVALKPFLPVDQFYLPDKLDMIILLF